MSSVISVEGLSKQYRIGAQRSTGLLSAQLMAIFRSSSPYQMIWALDDVTFDIGEGEVFGIVGRNGSGKSTLLKILAGIVRPTRGTASVRGRVGALLEVGTGFHSELTGRENILFNGTLLGMQRSEIAAKFDEIVEFSGLEKYIDTPIKFYSSGMHARLGFAVAAHLKPEILIVDEVLSVGDMLFQQKSLNRMNELTQSGITTLFVSHNLGSVAAVCGRGMLLDSGVVKSIGAIESVLSEYVAGSGPAEGKVTFSGNEDCAAPFIEASLEREDGSTATEFDLTEDIWLRLRYSVKTPMPGLQLTVKVNAGYEDVAQTFDTDADSFLGAHPAGMFEKRLRINRMFLKEGRYSLSIFSGIPKELFDQHDGAISFDVLASSLDTQFKSYRRDRLGDVVFQGEWSDARSV